MAPGRKKQYALVWYINSAFKDTVELSNFPKNQRYVNAVWSLNWVDHATKRTSKASAKILSISADREMLDRIIVSDEGEINDPTNKIFHKEMITEKKSLAKERKFQRSVKNSCNRQIENLIKNDGSIVPACNGPRLNKQKSYVPISSEVFEDATNFQQYQNENSSCNSINYQQQPTPMANMQHQPTPTNWTQKPSQGQPAHMENMHSQPTLTNWTQGPNQEQPAPMANMHPQPTLTNWTQRSNQEQPDPSTGKVKSEQSISNNWTQGRSQPALSMANMESMSNNWAQRSSNGHSTHTEWIPESNRMNTNSNSIHSYNSMTAVQESSNVSQSLCGNTSQIMNIEEKDTSFEYSHNDDEIISLESDHSATDDDFDMENYQTAARAMAATIPGKVTRKDIAFQELLLAAMKHSYKINHKVSKKSKKIFEIDDYYLHAAPKMKEISDRCGFYLPENKITYLNLLAQGEHSDSSWKIIVREVLLEIYGTTLGNYSAKAKRGGRQPIHPQLFTGLFGWAREVSNETLDKKTYVNYINKCASNKRKYTKRQTKKESSSSSQAVVHATSQKTSKIQSNSLDAMALSTSQVNPNCENWSLTSL